MRKITSFILVLMLMINVFPCPIYAAGDNRILQFEEDFNKGNLTFKIDSRCYVSDGTLNTRPGVFASFSLNQADLVWKNYEVEFDLLVREIGDDDNTLFFSLRGNRYSARVGTASFSGFDNIFKVGKWFECKFVAKDEWVTWYARERGSNVWLDLGTQRDSERKPGTFAMDTWKAAISLDNVRIYAAEDDDLIFRNKWECISVGEEKRLDFENKQGIDITYEISNKDIADLSPDGTVKIKKTGTCMITAKDKEGNVADNCVLQGVKHVEKIHFEWSTYGIEVKEKDLHCGETANVSATYTPYDSTWKALDWKISDNNIVEIIGEGYQNRTIKAKKQGTAILTVTSLDTGVSESVTINVLPEREIKTRSVLLQKNGAVREYPSYIYGLHYDSEGETGYGVANDPKLNFPQLIKDMGWGSLRMPSGWGANWWVWQWGQRYHRGKGNVTSKPVKDFIAFSENADAQTVWVAAPARPKDPVTGKTVSLDVLEKKFNNEIRVDENGYAPIEAEDIIGLIDEMKKYTDRTPMIEMGNELYAISVQDLFPRSSDYLKAMKDVTTKVHKHDADAKIGLVALERNMERRILADPNNFSYDEDNLAYTQGSRVYEWNPVLAQDTDAYDAVISHNYMTFSSISFMTADEFRQAAYTFMEDDNFQVSTLSHQFGYKPVWITEMSSMDETKSYVDDSSYLNIMQSPFMAILGMLQTLNYTANENVEVFNWHDTTHPSFGFVTIPAGSVQKQKYAEAGLNYVLHSKYYTLKEAAQVVRRNSHLHELSAVDANYTVQTIPWYRKTHAWEVSVPEIKTFAFGDSENVNEMVIFNCTADNMEVELDGTELQKTWSFSDNGWTNYAAEKYEMPEDYDKVVKPVEYTDEPFSEKVTLKPYEVIVVNVRGEAAVNYASDAGELSQLNRYLLKNAIALSPDSNIAYVDNNKVNIDDGNEDVKVFIENDRTFVPLRFIAENMKLDVDFDEGTGKIVIKDDKKKVVFNIGSDSYTVDGIKHESDCAPMVRNDRVFVPVRTISDALGYKIFYNERGLIVVYDLERVTFMFAVDTFSEDISYDLIDDVLALFGK